jgi:hypothetical protein
MLKKAMLGVVFGLTMVPVLATANTLQLPGNEALVRVNMPSGYATVLVKKGISAPVSMFGTNGQQWQGFKGEVRDMGKTVSYHFQVNDAYSDKTKESVHGLMPLRDGVATITVRRGVVPAVKG